MAETPREIRRYSRDEANAILPEVRDRVLRLRDAYAQMAGHHEKMRSLAPGNGGERQPEDWLGSSAEFYKQMRWFEEAGLLIRKIEEGLIDFPAELHGEEIFLCWKLGEESVDHWHDTDSGFAGRQPI